MRLRWFLRAACCVDQAVRGAECCNVLYLFPCLVGGSTVEGRVAAAAFEAAGGCVVCGVFFRACACTRGAFGLATVCSSFVHEPQPAWLLVGSWQGMS